MIYIDRSKIPMPSVLSSERIVRARHLAELAYPKRLRVSSQTRYEFDTFWYREVRATLSDALHGKCAYCESWAAATGSLDIEHFRPKQAVAEAPTHPGYWWLAYEWSNILVACAYCNRRKANRFPVVNEARRAFRPEEMEGEVGLVLDPTYHDPSGHLIFNVEGTVSSDTDEGQTTIAVLDLNRAELVRRRADQAGQILRVIGMLQSDGPDSGELIAHLRAFTEPSSEFAALARQLALPVLAQHDRQMSTAQITEAWQEATPIVSKAHRKRIKESFRQFEEKQSNYSLETKTGVQTFRLQQRSIETIKIQNFKSLRDLQLEFPESPEVGSSWLMLLGENATGKSSILQAVAMALMGTDSFVRVMNEEGNTLDSYIRQRATKAFVSVKISGFVGPHTMTLEGDTATFQSPTGEKSIVQFSRGKFSAAEVKQDVPTVLLGYGATRLLRHRDDEHYGLPNCRVDNLFDPLKPLLNAEKWLLGLDKRTFDTVVIVLKDILNLDNEAAFSRRKGKVWVSAHGPAVTLKQLSDGYQSVIAVSADILEVAIRLWPNASSAEGIVLLDEIGSHLHPGWRMRIVGSLRRALPRLQFLVTTHEPLCLRGIGKGEVVVLRRDENHLVEVVKDLPSPADFRVDQLLTSEFFGLNSTVDPDVEALFDEYYALLALSDRSSDQNSRLEELEAKLKDRRFVGETQRDQLMFEAIDKLVAKQRHGERLTVPQLNAAAVAAISSIWDES